MKNRALVPTPWSQVGIAILPGLVLLLLHPFSLPLISKALTFLGLAALMGLIVSIVVQVVARKTLFQVPVWALIPLGLLCALGLMATIGSLGFYPTFFLLILLGLVLARQNGLSAGLFVLAGAMIAASWAIEQTTYEDFGPYAAVLLHFDIITAVIILPPILVLRARSLFSQVAALLFPVVAYSAIFAFPQGFTMWFNIPAIECWLFAPAMASTAKRLSATVWICAGLAVLVALLAVPTSILTEFHQNLPVTFPQPVEVFLAVVIFFMPSLVLVIAALLLYSGVTHSLKWWNVSRGEDENSQTTHPRLGSTTIVTFALSVLLLAVILYDVYWLMVWDSTTDALDYFWLIIPVQAALFAGIVLVIALPRWTKLTGLVYALLLPTLIIAVSANAKSVNFRQLTQERAGQVSLAVETYFSREGRYPQDLRQLAPWYILFLPEPVTIYYEQAWCYDGGKDYYRLGYVDREHWSSLNFIGRTYIAKGSTPVLPPICDKEIAAGKERQGK